LLRENVSGRRAGVLRRFVEDDSLMSKWDIAMRYAPAADIQVRFVERWRSQAHELVDAMETG
jgi:hypothetical protein